MATCRKSSTSRRLWAWVESLDRRDQLGLVILSSGVTMATLVAVLASCGWFW